MKKRILASILALTIVLGGMAVFTNNVSRAEETSVVASIDMDTLDAYYRKDTLMLPLRKIAEGELGYKLKWDGKEKSVELQKAAQWTKITIDENSYFFARMAPFGLSKAPELKNGLTYVPVEFFSEVLKYDISLEGDKLIIKDPVPETEEINFNGFIKDMDNEGKRILVLGDGTTEYSNYIWLGKTEESVIVNTRGEDIPFEDLKVGSRVIVTMPEIVALSYPAQGSMVKIVVIEDKTLEIGNKEIKNGEKNIDIKYPEVKGLKDEAIQEKINGKIEDFVNTIAEDDLYKDLELDYEITLVDDNKISFLFKGQFKMDGFEGRKYVVKSLNLDLESAEEIFFENYFKEDKKSQEKLNELLNRFAKENGLENFEAEGASIYFWDDSVVVYYWPLDDSAEIPVELYIPVKDVEDIIK